MSKETQRRLAARRQQRNTRLAKGFVVALAVIVLPVLIFIALRG